MFLTQKHVFLFGELFLMWHGLLYCLDVEIIIEFIRLIIFFSYMQFKDFTKSQ